MIDLYYWPTPNGWKISIMLEECGLEYRLVPVDIGRGDQFKPEFLAISPNNRMPAIVDHDVEGEPVSVFESGAILMYLAEKTGRFLTGRFLPVDPRARIEVVQWVFWQVGGLGPMAGQLGHFTNYAPEKIGYALNRYGDEYNRLLGSPLCHRQATGGKGLPVRRLFHCRHGLNFYRLALGRGT